MIPDLSVIIPARNEEFAAITVQSVLKAARANTEVILVCDGAWPDPPVDDYPNLQILRYGKSIGQRAAINRAAMVSKARFIMKLDAHCLLADGFDLALMERCEYDWTVVPRMYNLHVYDWQCAHCGGRTVMGPKPTSCPFCVNCARDSFRERRHRGGGGTFESKPFYDGPDRAHCCKNPKRCPGSAIGRGEFVKVMVMEPKDGKDGRPKRENDHMRFDNQLRFQYWGALGLRPEIQAQGDIADTMSLLGACRFMHRERFWELEGMDEAHGSWGQEGTEIACKTWLSGGRLVCNKTTWFSHMFRTQPVFSFPYPNPGIDRAREHSRWLWRGCNWPKALMPLSSLIELFHPVPSWNDDEIAKLKKEERRSGNPIAKQPLFKHERPVAPKHDLYIHAAQYGAGEEWIDVRDRLQSLVENNSLNVAVTNPVIAPGQNPCRGLRKTLRVSYSLKGQEPAETEVLEKHWLRLGQQPDVPKDLKKGIIYYTENQCPEPIYSAVQKQLKRCVNGHEIVSCSLQPIEFGRNVVLDRQRGILTYHLQILAALEASTADVVFLCEHDVLYHPSHFEFVPARKDVFYYNEHTYKVASDKFERPGKTVELVEPGQAMFYHCKQVSGLCAYRELLVGHYQRKIAKIVQNARDLEARGEPVKRDGFSQHMGYEPGCHTPPRGVDDYPAEAWMSPFPNVDIRHNRNLSATRWDPAEFRDQRTCKGFKLVDEVPGWGQTKGRFEDFIKDVVEGRAPING